MVTGTAGEISKIDQGINAIHYELKRRETILPLSAESWQAAWDKHPELHARERDLYRQRGIAQVQRDEQAHKQWVIERRNNRLRKCPTCGMRSLKARAKTEAA